MKIEKNIPIPKRSYGKRSNKYPLNEMSIGDSFKVDNTDYSKVKCIVTYYHKNSDKKFTTRKEDSGIRCWRIK